MPTSAEIEKLEREVSNAKSEVSLAEDKFDRADSRLSAAKKKLEEARAKANPSPVVAPIADWLDRKRVLGAIAPEGVRAIEQLIEDLR